MRNGMRFVDSLAPHKPVQWVFERLSLAFALALALLAVAMSSGPKARAWTSNYIVQAFAPASADLDGALLTGASQSFQP